MKLLKLFLESILRDSRLDSVLLDKIANHYLSEGITYGDLIVQAENFVFYKNERGYCDNVSSILNKIANQSNDSTIVYSNHILSLESEVFPSNSPIYNENLITHYEKAVELIFSKNLTLEDFTEQLFYLQKFYLSNVSSVGKPSTVSQFEFLKSRAAFAQCLFEPQDSKKPFLLLCGDLSGIQSFIFDIHSSRAYKSLKGRSFYLQLVIESLIARILKETQTTIANIIYSAGGKFYLLLPNSIEVNQEIENIEKIIEKELFKRFELGLYVCLGSIGFGINEFYGIESDETQIDGLRISGIGDLWKTVSEKAALKKSRKYNSLLFENFEQLFEGKRNEDFNGVGMTTCAVLGIPVKENPENNIADKGETPIYVHKSVKEQTLLGQKLQRNTVLIQKEEKFESSIQPYNLGNYYDLVHNSVENSKAVLLNPISENDYLKFIEKYNSTRFMFYGGNQQAEKDGKLLSLEEIATPISDKTFNKIGVLKMDVDNLGSIFSSQVNEFNTFASMSDLSSRLDWFFGGYLNTIRDSKFKEMVNIIYSGGDDLCAVGKWDAVLDFASDVRIAFRKYIGESDGIGLSAGYSIFNPKFPISKAIQEAENNLKQAKDFKINGSNSNKANKNAINLLGLNVNWQFDRESRREWEFVKNVEKFFMGCLKEGILSKGTLYKLFDFKAQKDGNVLDWRWQSAYFFAKLGKPELNILKTALITDKFESDNIKGNFPNKMFDLIILAAKLTDYNSR